MPGASRLSADVRFTEVTLGNSIVQNSNITGAMVSVGSSGPIGPTFYSSFEAFAADHGYPNARVSFDHYAAFDYFRDGNALWVTRAVTSSQVSGDAAKYGTISLGLCDGTITPPYGTKGVAGAAINPDLDTFALGTGDWQTATFGVAGVPLYLFAYRKGPGSNSSKVSIRIKSYNMEKPAFVNSTNSNTGGTLTFNGTLAYRYRVAAINADGQVFAATTRSVTPVGPTSTGRIRVFWSPVPGAVGYVVYGRSDLTTNYTLAVVGQSTYEWFDDGSSVEDTTGTLFPSVPKSPITSLTDAALPVNPKFTLEVYDSSVSTTLPVETFACSVTEQSDEMGQQMETEQRINTFSQYLRCLSAVPLSPTPELLRMYSTTNYVDTVSSAYISIPMGAGQSGIAPTASEINTAWDRFSNKEKYIIDVLINAGRAVPTVQRKMEEIARVRGDSVAFLDCPAPTQTASAVMDYRRLTLNLNSSYAALFCSDLLEDDLQNGKVLYVPPSGAMAGLLARTSRLDQPYRSMAGLNRGQVNALDVRNTYTEGEANQLVTAQINYMRKFLGKGIPLWEQWTLSAASNALQFLNVRVLCNVLKRSMYDFLLYSLQEPGDEILQKQITHELGKYLDYVKGTRGISYYQVVCSSSNNLPATKNIGLLKVAVVIIPILAVRGIDLSLVISKEGLTVSETEIAALTL